MNLWRVTFRSTWQALALGILALNACVAVCHAGEPNDLVPEPALDIWHEKIRVKIREALSTLKQRCDESAQKKMEESWTVAGLPLPAQKANIEINLDFINNDINAHYITLHTEQNVTYGQMAKLEAELNEGLNRLQQMYVPLVLRHTTLVTSNTIESQVFSNKKNPTRQEREQRDLNAAQNARQRKALRIAIECQLYRHRLVGMPVHDAAWNPPAEQFYKRARETLESIDKELESLSDEALNTLNSQEYAGNFGRNSTTDYSAHSEDLILSWFEGRSTIARSIRTLEGLYLRTPSIEKVAATKKAGFVLEEPIYPNGHKLIREALLNLWQSHRYVAGWDAEYPYQGGNVRIWLAQSKRLTDRVAAAYNAGAADATTRLANDGKQRAAALNRLAQRASSDEQKFYDDYLTPLLVNQRFHLGQTRLKIMQQLKDFQELARTKLNGRDVDPLKLEVDNYEKLLTDKFIKPFRDSAETINFNPFKYKRAVKSPLIERRPFQYAYVYDEQPLGAEPPIPPAYTDSKRPLEIHQVLVLNALRKKREALRFPGLNAGVELGRNTRMLFVHLSHLPDDFNPSLDLSSNDPQIKYTFMKNWADKELMVDFINWFNTGWHQIPDANGPDAERLRNGLEAVLVKAEMLPGTLPGLKQFQICGELCEWILDEGQTKAHLEVIRPLPPRPNEFESLSVAFLPEQLRVRLIASAQVGLTSVQFMVGADGAALKDAEGKPIVLSAERQADGKTFLTAPIEVTQEGRPVPPLSPGGRALFLKPGQTLQFFLLQGDLFVMGSPLAAVRVELTPDRVGNMSLLWRDALRRAATERRLQRSSWEKFKGKLDNPMSEDEIHEFCNLIITDGEFRKVNLRLKHLAAMYLLRDVFVEMTTEHLRELEVFLKSFAEKNGDFWCEAFYHALKPHIHRPDFYFGLIEVGPPLKGPGGGQVKFRDVYTDEFKTRYFGDGTGRSLKLRDEYVLAATRQALGNHIRGLGDAIKRAKAIKDDDYRELLSLTGMGFRPVVDSLIPRLMRLDEKAKPAMRWIPDLVARDTVNEIDALCGIVRANKELSSADTQAVQVYLAGCSLIPIVVPVGSMLRLTASVAMSVADLADVAANILPEYLKGQEDLKFAQETVGILGADRLNIALLQATPLWGTFLAAAGAGIGFFADILDMLPTASIEKALSRFDTVMNAFEDGGIAALRKMPREEQLAFCTLMADARTAERSGQKLTEQQAVALRQAQRMQAEVEELLLIRARKAEPPLIRKPHDESFRIPDKTEFKLHFQVNQTDGSIRTHKFDVNERLGAGAYATVYGLRDKPDKALKLVRPAYFDTDELLKIFERMRYSEDLLEKAGIPYLKMTSGGGDKKLLFLLQERLPKDSVMLNPKNYYTGPKIDRRYVPLEDINKTFTPEMQEAVVELYANAAKNRLLILDGHVGNIYLTKKNGRWVAGILDSDMILHGDRLKEMEGISPYVMHRMEGLHNHLGLPQAFNTADPKHFAEQALIGHGWLSLNLACELKSGMIDLEIVKKYFPDVITRAPKYE